ncbi:MAG: glucose-6-phosphate isomerase [Legionellales bacterium]
MMQLTDRMYWDKLKKKAESTTSQNRELIKSSGSLLQVSTIRLDYSSQQVDDQVLELLFELAKECELKKNIEDLLSGALVNTTENKPALHIALRTSNEDPIRVLGHNIIPSILNARERMRHLSDKIRNKEWFGYSGKPITDVVNIGIGGSKLGPLFCISALADFSTDQLKFHFISDFDPKEFKRLTAALCPETTLFIVASKSFTTLETLYNTKQALAWIGQPQHNDKHFIAVTADRGRAEDFGITEVLPIWEWVGGRFSSCSAINLITCIAIGYEQFSEMLIGAEIMDNHFYSADLETNLPVLLALLGIWNINFLGINNLLILTYADDLNQLVPYLQQLDMESNGKSIDKQGHPILYSTGPIVWGGSGNQAQHSYYQLLCQGTHKIAADFISSDVLNDQDTNKVCGAQKAVLTQGVFEEDNPYSTIIGAIPINHISLRECNPKSIGSLIALYEHKIFIQSIIWNINPFDQPGVESSKRLMNTSQHWQHAASRNDTSFKAI